MDESDSSLHQPLPQTSTRMKSQKTRDTKCERDIRKILYSRGLRYRVDTRPLIEVNRKADIVFRSPKVAVFIDGCFWHGCQEHRRPSKSNSEWWANKISSNQTRDRDTDSRLDSAGWKVIRAWEHENPEVVAARIGAAVMERRLG